MKYAVKRRLRAKAYSKKKTMNPHFLQFPFPRRNNIVLPGRIGVGQSVVTNLRTSFFANVTAPVSGIYTAYLKPGSAFDPCGDISTIQPVGFDQWAALYNRYKVNKAYITISITGNSSPAATTYNWVGAAYPAVDPTALTTYQAAASQSYAKTFEGNFAFGTTLASASSLPCIRKFVIDNQAVVGATGDTFDMGAAVTADPTALQYAVLPILLQATVAGQNATWIVKVDIIQNITFSGRKNVVDA